MVGGNVIPYFPWCSLLTPLSLTTQIGWRCPIFDFLLSEVTNSNFEIIVFSFIFSEYVCVW